MPSPIDITGRLAEKPIPRGVTAKDRRSEQTNFAQTGARELKRRPDLFTGFVLAALVFLLLGQFAAMAWFG